MTMQIFLVQTVPHTALPTGAKYDHLRLPLAPLQDPLTKLCATSGRANRTHPQVPSRITAWDLFLGSGPHGEGTRPGQGRRGSHRHSTGLFSEREQPCLCERLPQPWTIQMFPPPSFADQLEHDTCFTICDNCKEENYRSLKGIPKKG